VSQAGLRLFSAPLRQHRKRFVTQSAALHRSAPAALCLDYKLHSRVGEVAAYRRQTSGIKLLLSPCVGVLLLFRLRSFVRCYASVKPCFIFRVFHFLRLFCLPLLKLYISTLSFFYAFASGTFQSLSFLRAIPFIVFIFILLCLFLNFCFFFIASSNSFFFQFTS
jgi:hypothetical protein